MAGKTIRAECSLVNILVAGFALLGQSEKSLAILGEKCGFGGRMALLAVQFVVALAQGKLYKFVVIELLRRDEARGMKAAIGDELDLIAVVLRMAERAGANGHRFRQIAV